MPVFRFIKGSQVEAATSQELVSALRHSAQNWLPSTDDKDFMEKLARWCKSQDGATIRTGNYQEFLLMLQSNRYLAPITNLWQYYLVDSIQLGLLPSKLMGWDHNLYWADLILLVYSTTVNGGLASKFIDVNQIAETGYLAEWILEYDKDLKRAS